MWLIFPGSVTIRASDVVERECSHCGTVTAQVGPTGFTCLQCLADGGNGCSLAAFNRWQTT